MERQDELGKEKRGGKTPGIVPRERCEVRGCKHSHCKVVHPLEQNQGFFSAMERMGPAPRYGE
eukprot:scaffold431_cov334-Pavlova_lutheri.AAC.12